MMLSRTCAENAKGNGVPNRHCGKVQQKKIKAKGCPRHKSVL